MVNRDALLNEIRNALVKISHGVSPGTRVTMGFLGVTSLINKDWTRENIIDLIAALVYTTEQADGMLEGGSVTAD